MDPPPEYLEHRIKMFERLKAEQDAFVKSNENHFDERERHGAIKQKGF